jgi:hypothetical protein
VTKYSPPHAAVRAVVRPHAAVRRVKNGPQSNTQGVQNNFDPCLSRITQRDAFMHKASKSVGSTGRPPENVPIALESRQKVTVSSELQDMGV